MWLLGLSAYLLSPDDSAGPSVNTAPDYPQAARTVWPSLGAVTVHPEPAHRRCRLSGAQGVSWMGSLRVDSARELELRFRYFALKVCRLQVTCPAIHSEYADERCMQEDQVVMNHPRACSAHRFPAKGRFGSAKTLGYLANSTLSLTSSWAACSTSALVAAKSLLRTRQALYSSPAMSRQLVSSGPRGLLGTSIVHPGPMDDLCRTEHR